MVEFNKENYLDLMIYIQEDYLSRGKDVSDLMSQMKTSGSKFMQDRRFANDREKNRADRYIANFIKDIYSHITGKCEMPYARGDISTKDCYSFIMDYTLSEKRRAEDDQVYMGGLPATRRRGADYEPMMERDPVVLAHHTDTSYGPEPVRGGYDESSDNDEIQERLYQRVNDLGGVPPTNAFAVARDAAYSQAIKLERQRLNESLMEELNRNPDWWAPRFADDRRREEFILRNKVRIEELLRKNSLTTFGNLKNLRQSNHIDFAFGKRKSGKRKSGKRKSGKRKSGKRKSGKRKSGKRKSGKRKSGKRKSGKH